MFDGFELVPPWFFVCTATLFGALFGSFINAAIYRLPRDISLLKKSRSFCPQCNALIHWYDNIPILSFALLRGKCRKCHKRIPRRYLTVELIVASLFGLAAFQFFVLNRPPQNPGGPFVASTIPAAMFAIQLFLIADLTCATFTDLETWYIPLETTWPWMLLGLILAPIFPDALHSHATAWVENARLNGFIDSVQGLIVGGGILWSVGFVCIVLIGKEGMGGGDAHLVGMIGALLGWKAALLTVFIGIFIGCIIGVSSIAFDRIQRRRLGAAYKPRQATFDIEEGEDDAGPPPLWPYLAMGAFVLLFELSLILFGKQGPNPITQNVVPLLCILIGALLMLAFPYMRKLIQQRIAETGSWREGEVKDKDDGKQEEVLQGNYIPFGPSLAIAGLIVAFYQPKLCAFAEWYFGSRYTPAGDLPWDTYLRHNPIAVQDLDLEAWAWAFLPWILVLVAISLLAPAPQELTENAAAEVNKK